MTRKLIVMLVAVAAVPATTALRQNPSQTGAPPVRSAFTNAIVIDGTGRPAMGRMDIVIEDGRITALHPSGTHAIPSEIDRTDLRGMYVIPGLIDSHVHLGTRERPAAMTDGILKSVFMDGITTVRDMGGSLNVVRPLAQRAVKNNAQMPRIYYSAIMAGPGRWFDGDLAPFTSTGFVLGASPVVRRVDEHTDVRSVITAARAAGATGIKIYNAVSPTLMTALATEAHRQGMRMWSHLEVNPGRPTDVISAGVDVVSHADQFLAEVMDNATVRPDSIRRRVRDNQLRTTSPDDSAVTRVLRRMRAAGTVLDPTLFVMLPRSTDANGETGVLSTANTPFHFALEMTKRAMRAGIPIVAGTDGIGGSTATLHAELQLLVDSAGLTPLQALQAATLNGARALGMADSLGTITPGRIADLVVLRCDPSRDIACTQDVALVVKAGHVFHRSTGMKPGPLARPPRARTMTGRHR